MTDDNDEVTIVFDAEVCRPACALLQPLLGGTLGVAGLFDARTWLLHPTPGMRAFRATRGEVRQLAEVVEKKHGGGQ